MSAAAAGWLQFLLLVVALAAVHRPLGNWMAHVFTTARHWRVERLVYRVVGVDADSEQRWPVYLRSVLAFSAVGVLVALPPAAGAAVAAAGQRDGRRRALVCVEHRGQLRDQHELAVVLRRVDDGPPGADGRPGGAELRLGRRRHRGGDRVRPRLRPHADRPARATSGSTWRGR